MVLSILLVCAARFGTHDIAPGQGDAVKAGDRVSVELMVTREDGKMLANSHKRGLPYTICVGSDDPNMSELVVGMREGGIREAVVTPWNSAWSGVAHLKMKIVLVKRVAAGSIEPSG